MKLRIEPLKVGKDESFEQDVLDRKDFGQSLLNLIIKSEDELVISIDGQWGDGKSTFVRMWQGMLTDAEMPNIYIDAFASDYIDDPFLAVASAITTYIEENNSKGNKKSAEFVQKAKEVGSRLLPWGTKIAFKAVTAGLINGSDIEQLVAVRKDIANDLATTASDFVGKQLEAHKEDQQLFEDFKKELTNITDDKKLVIIIDELDRCKPTYALGLLEKIKHLFSTKNVFFVLVMHKQELEKSIKCIYGDIDAYAYLQKFIHVQTTLPKKTDGNNNDLEKYAQHLFKSHNFETWGHSQDLLGYVEQLAVHFQLSLRQLEKVFTNLAIFYAAVVEKSFQDPTIVSFLAVMKVIDPSICQSLLFRKISYSQLCDKTGIVKSRELSDWLVDRIHYFTCSKEEYTQLEVDNRVKQMEHIQYMNNNKGYICNLDRLDIMPMLIRRMSLFTA
jgi:hypothetical protein